MLTFGTAMMALFAVVLLVVMFYVLTSGKLPFAWQRRTDSEGHHAASSWEARYAATHKVILHNDDYTPMERVVKVLRKVIPAMNHRRAFSIMMEAHAKGRVVVIECPQESAELYVESLNSEGLTATAEPD